MEKSAPFFHFFSRKKPQPPEYNSEDELRAVFTATIRPGFEFLDSIQASAKLLAFCHQTFGPNEYTIDKTPNNFKEYKDGLGLYCPATIIATGPNSDELIRINAIIGHDPAFLSDAISFSGKDGFRKSTILERNNYQTTDNGQKTEEWLNLALEKYSNEIKFNSPITSRSAENTKNRNEK